MAFSGEVKKMFGNRISMFLGVIVVLAVCLLALDSAELMPGLLRRMADNEKSDYQRLMIEELQGEIAKLKLQVNKVQDKVQDKVEDKFQGPPDRPHDLDDLKHLVGPRSTPVNTTKILVTVCIGKSDKEGVNKLMTETFNSDIFSFMLFHYDNSTWNEYPWYSQLNVVAIRVLHKMKFWYIKRFVTPAVASAFSHVIILDADVGFDKTFNARKFLEVTDSFNISLSQPVHTGQTTSHMNLWYKDGTHIGRYQDFVECGPAAFLTADAYKCVYNLIQPDLTSGWGLDIYWVSYLRTVCSFSNESVAAIDAFKLLHEVPSGKGTASSNVDYNNAVIHELYAYNERFKNLTIYWGRPDRAAGERDIPFGHKSCINTPNIASPTACS